MKAIIIYIISSLFYLSAYAQGIEFNRYESEQTAKTSLSLPEIYKEIDCKNYFSIQYDLAIHDYTSFGYILRISSDNNSTTPIYSFVFSYGNKDQSYLKFNIETKQCLFTDTLYNVRLGARHWIPIKMTFFTQKDSINISINGHQYTVKNIGTSYNMLPKFLFGSSSFGEETPSFAIKNLQISGVSNQLNIPLNENSGNTIHEKGGKIVGKAIGPIWLINQSYHWKLLYTYTSDETSGYNYDNLQNRFIFFNRDSIYIYYPNSKKEEKIQHSGISMPLHLGTSFFNEKDTSLYIYEVINDSNTTTFTSLSLSTYTCNKLSKDYLPFQRHHHANYFNPNQQNYYIFGGFGNRKYSKDLYVYNLSRNSWSTIPLKGANIAPRFFSSMGYLSENELLIFGGTGNESGEQSVGKQFYYDLYKVNLQDSTAYLLNKYVTKRKNFVPVRNLLVSDNKQIFYTLCYPPQEANSYIQLYRFLLNSNKFEILGDSIPMESKAILSNANLFYNTITNEFYCCTQEFDEKGHNNSIIKLYSLAAPAINAADLNTYNSDNFLPHIVIISVVFIIFFILKYISYKHKNKQYYTPKLPSTNHITKYSNSLSPQINAIYLLGNFQVFDNKGRDITYLFSSKIRQLFLIILVNKIQKNQGISSSYIYGMLWPDKEINNAKNLKGVTLNKLKKLLSEIKGISLNYYNHQYQIELSEDIYCDYKEYYQLLNEIQNTNIAYKDETLQKFTQILKRGKFLQSIEEEIFDTLKSYFENQLYEIAIRELNNLYSKGKYEQTIQLAEIIFSLDSFNDIALWYVLNSLQKSKKEDIAMKKYYAFTTKYHQDLHAEYNYSYTDIIHQDLRKNFN